MEEGRGGKVNLSKRHRRPPLALTCSEREGEEEKGSVLQRGTTKIRGPVHLLRY